jgi:hypothetical protein
MKPALLQVHVADSVAVCLWPFLPLVSIDERAQELRLLTPERPIRPMRLGPEARISLK